ncbi:uncharacterized protein [Salminus brasiliensis]|uniref:uncharacterized protein n=1 Tax=Salminus brasiliensis TaxID=930266 RepID=UPI003B82FCDA
MEAILTLIRTTLPSLSEDRLQSLMHRLDAIGVGRFVDLRLVTAADLEGLLQPTQCRRLMEVFNSGPSDREPTQSAAGPMEPSASASEEFQIPWEKFPPELVKAMIEKTRPHPSLRREMVRIIIDDFLASKQKRPARDTLRQIARELVQKYPRSFCDLCGDSVVGPGFTCLLDQMENRVENCTRTLKRPAEGGTGAMQYDPYGCAQWQPDLPTTKDEPSQTDQKAELQNAYVRNSLPETYVRKLMAETYYSQRISINLNNKTVRELKDEWPYLFEATHFFEHTERLLGIPVQKRLGEEWSKKGKTVMNFFARTKVTPSNFQDPLELLSGIGKYLGDNTEVLLIKIEGINTSTLSLPSTPCVVILGDERYLMAVDQTIVNDHVRCPLTALTYLFCLFYVLNIRYPKDAALSLEFIKSCLLGISPERGKETMQDVRHPKLLKFLSELNDYQNPWTV